MQATTTRVVVNLPGAAITYGSAATFLPTAYDQFNNVISTNVGDFDWQIVSGPGSLQGNVYTAPAQGEAYAGSAQIQAGKEGHYATALIEFGQIAGTVYSDDDGNGSRSDGEAGIDGWQVYLDISGDGQLDGEDFSTTTDANGNYALDAYSSGYDSGSHPLRARDAWGWQLTSPQGGSYELAADQTSSGNDFGEKPGVDLDIDSDNDNASSAPDRNAAEEAIEDDPATTGKVLVADTDDSDGNGYPDCLDSTVAADDPDLAPMALDIGSGLSGGTVMLSIESGEQMVRVFDATNLSAGPILGGSVTQVSWSAGSQPSSLLVQGIWPGGLDSDGQWADVTNVSGQVEFAVDVAPPADATPPPGPAVKATIIGASINPVVNTTITSTVANEVRTSTPLNLIPNPSAIVVEAVPDQLNAAHITLTQAFIAGGANIIKTLGDDDSRVFWTVASPVNSADYPKVDGTTDAHGGDLGFLSVGGKIDNTGKTISIYGTTPGLVRLIANAVIPSANGAPSSMIELAHYDVLVVNKRTIPYRVERLDARRGTGTTVHELQAVKQLRLANIYLRQAGVELIPDSDKTQADGFALVNPSHEIFVNKSFTTVQLTSMTSAMVQQAAQDDDKNNVLQIIYAESYQGGALGVAAAFPSNTFQSVTIPNYRQKPGDATAPVMKVDSAGRPAAGLWAVGIFHPNGGDNLDYANTLAHEVGHTLGLRHRQPDSDGVTLVNNNLMASQGPGEELDILQARAISGSPLIA